MIWQWHKDITLMWKTILTRIWMVGIIKRKKINRSKCMEIHELGDKLILKYQIK